MDDERLAKIEQEKQNAINNSTNTYNQLINENQDLYNKQLEYANKYEQTQNDILNQQLAENQRLIEQQKEEARKNKAAEERKALNDYEAYNNPYGYQAEARASSGLLNSGISETAKLGSFNTYQNRLATANKVMQDAITQYDNDMNKARLENNAAMAQNALNRLQLELEYATNYYSGRKDLTLGQMNYNQGLNDTYFNRYQTEYGNIQKEREAEEAIRQYNEKMAYQRERDKVADQQWAKEYALAQQKANASSINGSGSNGEFELNENNGGETVITPTNTTNTSTNTTTISKVMSLNPAALSTEKARTFFKGLKTSYNQNTLVQLLYNAYQNATINDNDIKTILKVYNLK
ncbi:MAG: hypothetical protein LIR50_07185 [Bacillota bacterium]|nr:hypothetical protein [Bacillota bacterium]